MIETRGRKPIDPRCGDTGLWTVLGLSDHRGECGAVYWWATCSCSPSIKRLVIGQHIRSGRSRGCEECRGERIVTARFSHAP